jgi:alpha-N-arabinofuranosidase
VVQTTLAVRPDEPIGTISPRLYGQFAEHLGRCCYDGLWDGCAFRSDVVAALRELPVPLLRWPGGCYADHYHWRDGIGAAAERPRRLGMSCGLQVEDDNSLGTHEFIALCEMLGAEPYLAGNVGSGSVQELCDWVEYCNSGARTELSALRASNGAANAFNVKLWGVGNENWGCGGNFDAVSYAYEYRRYATMLRHVDPFAELVVCGHDDAWNERLLETLAPHARLIDHVSIHRYWGKGGPALEFDDEQYYTLLSDAQATESFVVRTAELIGANISGRQIGIALDEWGVWHPEAKISGTPPYEQPSTLRDALAAAIALEGFHRQCRVLSMANLAQVVNVLQAVVMTDGPRMWRTPTYHALRLHAPHIGATALPVAVLDADTLLDGSPAVSGTASRRNGSMSVTLINRHRLRGADVCVDLGLEMTEAQAQILTAAEPNATNCAEEPDRVSPTGTEVRTEGRRACRLELPPHSMATITVR